MRKLRKQKNAVSVGNRTTESLKVKRLIDDYIYRIDLDADYQREKVWSTLQQELLLDSILNDIDIPKLYLAEVRDNKQFDYECIDGKQRMLTLLGFIKPENDEKNPLMIRFLSKRYTYKQLKETNPNVAKKFDDYELQFVIYKQDYLDEEFIKLIFIRLQLGMRLNSGELLNAESGAMRDFIFKEIDEDGPFLRNTNLSVKRYSRQFTLAQICINAFSRNAPNGEFVRARLDDLRYFFKEQEQVAKDDSNLARIREVLKIMDEGFGESAYNISSRATAVSAYLFVEKLYIDGKKSVVPIFAKFYVELLNKIKHNMELLSKFERPENSKIMEGFQKYITQASVEPSSIRRRDEFLREAFAYYTESATKGKIIGNK